MARIFNEQRRLGVVIVPDGTLIYNNQPVIGIRDAGAALFVGNQRTLGIDVQSAAGTYDDQPIVGAVQIVDGRVMYNGRRVVPCRTNGAGAGPVAFPALTTAFYRMSAENPANTSSTYSQTFAPSAVDMANGKLAMATGDFLAWTTFPASKGTPVVFTSTGSLPAEIADPARDYFLSPNAASGYDVYASPSGADWQAMPGALTADDAAYAAQNFAQRVNKITFSSQGTGTHRVQTKAEALVSVMANLVPGKNYSSISQSVTDKHSFAEKFSDSAGDKYFRFRRLARALANGYGDGDINYGKVFPMSGDKFASRAEVGGKRTITTTIVMFADLTNEKGVARSNVPAANVNISTGVFTQPAGVGATSMSLVTGEPTNVKAHPGATLPSPLSAATTYYARTSGATFTLHPTAADANANTNPVAVTSQGAGICSYYQTGIPGDVERQRFALEHIQPGTGGGNVLTPRYLSLNGGNVTIRPADIVQSGAASGEVGAVGRTSRGGGESGRVYITIPPGAVAPTRLDTGLPLVEGFYYQSLKPGSSVATRLHDTLASAQAAIGIATTALTGANNCIRFQAGSPKGRYQFEFLDTPAWNVSGEGPDALAPVVAPATVPWTPPLRTKGVLTMVKDYNDPAAAFVRDRWYWNGVKVADYELSGNAKGNTEAAVNDGVGGWTIGNSAQGHVPWEGRLYEIVMQASTSAFNEAEIIGPGSLHDYYLQHYHLTS